MEAHEKFMREALREASYAAAEDEVPIGAVVVWKGRVVAKGHNMTERLVDPTAHAEMIAITAATEAVGGKYLNECTLYVTVEPCPMCAGALIASRVSRVVYGAKDPVAGAFGTVVNLPRYPLGSSPEVTVGVMEEECRTILQDFFRTRRK